MIAPADTSYYSVAFHPIVISFIFAKRLTRGMPGSNLYREPVFGGTPQALVRDIDTNISFSPDGKRMTYARFHDPDLEKF